MDQTVVETRLFRKLARCDTRVSGAHKQTLGGIEKGLLGLFARRRDPDPLALCGFDR
jgi:hypothetical protein